MKASYFDHNATTPPHPEVKSRIAGWLEEWGNPSSIHWAGRGPKALVRVARQNFSELVGCEPLELVFTSGGSEANSLALLGTLPQTPTEKNHVLVSSVEHPSVRKAALALTQRGYRVDFIRVNREGEFDFEHYEDLLSDQTALVSVMLANNETGHIFPIARIVEQAKSFNAIFHCDAVQALGKIPVNLKILGVDLATFSGHKFYGLKGSGVLFCKKGVNLKPLILGGGQERGRRAGTENTLAIASLGFMCTQSPKIFSEAIRLRQLRDLFESRLVQELPGVKVTGAQGSRLPNTSNLVIEGIDGETLLMNLDVQGFAVSTGAACSSGNPEPSPVLLSMGLTRAEAQSSLRISLGWENTAREVENLIEAVVSTVLRLRSFRSKETQVSYEL